MSPISNTLASDPAAIGSSQAAASPQTTQDQLTSRDTFLKLLVAQIKNQDPLNPTDPVQFVGQLTQYSELEQLIQINSGITTLVTPPAATGTGSDTQPNKTTQS